MGEKDTLIKEKLVYVGLVNLKDIYAYVYGWLKNEGYNIQEDRYKESIKGDSKDMEITWTANKGITDYFKSHIDIGWKVLGATEVEAEIDGKRKKMNKVAELEVKLKGVLESDAGGKWGASNTQKFFKEAYLKFVIPQRKSEAEDKVKELVQDLKNEIKAFLDLTGNAK